VRAVRLEGMEASAMAMPYRPGYGSRPVVLAGREELQDDVDAAIATIAGDRRAPNALIIVGPRGVGKSVMLDEIARRA
jgi:Cdc6-like AAA superfamily ATPase